MPGILLAASAKRRASGFEVAEDDALAWEDDYDDSIARWDNGQVAYTEESAGGLAGQPMGLLLTLTYSD